MCRLLLIVCLVALVVAGTAQTVLASDYQHLRGINTVRVVIDEISAVGQTYGLSTDRVRLLVENKLMEAGLKIVPLGNDVPSVYVQLNCLPAQDRVSVVHSICISVNQPVISAPDVHNLLVVAVKQAVLADRARQRRSAPPRMVSMTELSKSKSFFSAVWQTGSLGEVGIYQMPAGVLEQLTHELDLLKHDILLAHSGT